MKIRKIIFSKENKNGVRFYKKMLKWLDSPKRKKYNNPETLIAKSGIQEGYRVLEIGCGSGYFTEEIVKRIGAGGTVYAVDIHPIAIEEMKIKCITNNWENVICEQQNAMETTYEDGFFDLVVLYGVIPAPVISTKKLSKEIHRILKPGGSLAIWTAVIGWRPYRMILHGKFTGQKRNYPVFILKKETNEK